MRVLFVGSPGGNPTDGGASTFQNTLLAGLNRMEKSQAHDFFYIQPNPKTHVIHQCTLDNQIDFVWFMSPYYEEVEVPFAATVWDLGHREVPYFPEVSVSGWKFDHREGFYRYLLPRAAIVVIGNSVGAAQIHQFYQVPLENICCIPMPFNAQAFSGVPKNASLLEPLGLTPGEYLFYPAQFWPHKNHITLVDTLQILRSCGKDLKLVFCGSDKGNLSYVKEYVARNNLQDVVVFAGFVETSVLHQLYLNAFAMVFASLLGPDNIPPLEAMALGCPVVCANYAGARVQLEESALYFDGLDAHEAAAKVLRLYDVGERNRLLKHSASLIKARSEDEYFRKVGDALNRFARIRRLWGPCNSFKRDLGY